MIDKYGRECLVAEGMEGIEQYVSTLGRGLVTGLRNHLEGLPTGGFLRAILENNFREAIGRAHPDITLAQLKAIQELIHCYFPSASHGSPELVAAWLESAKPQTERAD